MSSGDDNGLRLNDAANALNMPVGRLRALVRAGRVPVKQRGSRGRGHPTLLDPNHIAEHLGRAEIDRLVGELAERLPDVMANAMAAYFQRTAGDRRAAGHTSALWFHAATAVRDELRKRSASVREVTDLPPAIERLRKIEISGRF